MFENSLSVENIKTIMLFSTEKAIFKAPYKITCKDKVIYNTLGYFQSLKITPSLENSPISDSHKMFFMKWCYPKEGPTCGAAGGSTNCKNAVDPKTWRKYVPWPYIYALSDLEGPVGSLFISVLRTRKL
jgi:hypothetical protein